MGNLIPALIFVIMGGAGAAWMYQTLDFRGWGMLLLIASLVFSWLALNQFGFFENARMRRELIDKLSKAGNEIPSDAPFVGFASPGFQSLLDPHQDLGFLIVDRDHITFLGEERKIVLPKGTIRGVRFRPNMHTILGLGRWVAIEGVLDGKPVRMQIEPRVYRTLLANRKEGKRLADRLRAWLQQKTMA